MPTVMSAEELAKWRFRTDEPTATQRNSIAQQCRDGKIAHARKMLGTWYVNCTDEWPELFPEEPQRAEPDAAGALGDLLIAVGKMLKEGAGNGEEERSGAA